MGRAKKKLSKSAKLICTKSEAHTYMELPASLRAIVRSYVRDISRRQKAIADSGTPAKLKKRYQSINDKISAAVEFLDPVVRPILLEDIKNKWGYNKSAARDYMARPTYYRQKSRLETEIARGLGLL